MIEVKTYGSIHLSPETNRLNKLALKQAEEAAEILRKRAKFKAEQAVRCGKYFRYPNPFSVMSQRTAEYAAEQLLSMAKPLGFLNHWKQRVRQQPFFHSTQERERWATAHPVKFRRPIPYKLNDNQKGIDMDYQTTE